MMKTVATEHRSHKPLESITSIDKSMNEERRNLDGSSNYSPAREYGDMDRIDERLATNQQDRHYIMTHATAKKKDGLGGGIALTVERHHTTTNRVNFRVDSYSAI